MKECRRNIELFYLLNKLTPDFRTIADFRKDSAAVDGGSHLIASYEVTNHNVDAGLIYETVKSAKELLEIETVTAVADKGYDSKEDILDCILDGTMPKDDIYKCMKAGILPNFYKNLQIKEEQNSLL